MTTDFNMCLDPEEYKDYSNDESKTDDIWPANIAAEVKETY